MKKTLILFLLILSIIIPSRVGAQYSFDSHPMYDSEEKVTFIVEMEGSPVLPQFKLSPDTVNPTKTKNAQMYRNALLKSHKAATDAISSELSDNVRAQYTYTELFNGFAIEAKYGDLEAIRNTEGVRNVYISSKRKADFRMSNASSMTHSLPSETLGYTGSGQVIAVIDNEFDVKHVAFSRQPENPKYTKDDMEAILSGAEFNASNDVNRVYESTKIPFRFDYGENDADTYDTNDAHGTHVAGIAAGNSPAGDFCGIAPDAQLVLMKTADERGYTDDAAVVAALDDAAKLGVCVINCSFGNDYEAKNDYNPALNTCFTNAYNTGIFISVAAGNRGRGFFGALHETADIDDSATGNPNALDTAISVNSVDNSVIGINISEITLGDGSVVEASPMYEGTASLTAGEYVYCKLGYPEDFEEVDANGKIAVIDRGIISFVEKSDNAKAAGAVGIIIINTEDSYGVFPTLSLPAVCVKSSSGSLLKEAPIKTISSVTPFMEKAFEADAIISDFSSYGTTEDLDLKPDISAPGGNIYSSVPGNKYKVSSGTSMSAPHISGVVAIINQYLEDMGCTAFLSERVNLISNMMMSSADVIYMKSDDEETKVPYSPRVQGAGMVNTANAIKTPVILYSDNGKTKLELGDNLTDTIDISFTAQNLTGNDVVYDKISAVALTDGYETLDGINYISGTRLLKSELINGSDAVVVPANSTVTVSAQLKLDKDELYENYLIFKNGFHIDGFIRMENTTSDIVSVGLPLMGFFGNWTQAPIFDTTMYDEGGSKLYYSDNGIYGTFLYTLADDKSIILGHNDISDTYNSDAIVISPNDDGYCDFIGLYLTAMRSIRDLEIMIVDEEDNILCVQGKEVISKFEPYDTIIEIPENISDGSYVVRLNGYMNYSKGNSLKHTLSIPLKVDRERPFVKGCSLKGNVLTVDINDNAGISGVIITDMATGEQAVKSYSYHITDDKITYIFENNTAPELSNIRMEVMDTAFNLYSYFLGGFSGKIGTHVSGISFDEKSYTFTFILDSEDEFSGASLVLAFYDEQGNLMHTNIKKNQSIASGEYEFTGDFDVSTADECKLFVWYGAENLMPLDTAKVFDLKMYGIN